MNFYGDINMYNLNQLSISGDISMANGDILAQDVFLNGNLECYYINAFTPAGPDILNIGSDPVKTSEIRMSQITNYYANLNMISGNIDAGTGDIINTGILSTGDITCTSLNITSGAITGSDITVDNLILNSSGKITCGTTPPTLLDTSLGYYYNYPSVQSTVTAVSTKYNPITNTAGGVNYFKAGIYTASIDAVIRFNTGTTAGNYVYNIGVASGTTIGTVTTSTVTNISPSSTTVRGFHFNNILNVDYNNSFTLCFTLSSDSFVNIFGNITTYSNTGGNVLLTLSGCVRRIA